MSYHANRGANNLPQEVRDAIPTMGVLSHWSPRGHGYGAGWSAPSAADPGPRDSLAVIGRHGWRRGGSGDPSSGQVPRLAHQPWDDLPFFVANEAFGSRHGWAESSLTMAENVVKTGWDVGRPDWLSTTQYNRIIF